jgi:hypothetical protein
MGSKQTTTAKADPWKPVQPYIIQGAQDASRLYNEGGFQVDPYSGQMVAGYDPMKAQADAGVQTAYGNAMDMAGQGQQALTAAMDPNARSAGWDGVVQNTINGIMPGINSSFAGSGMTGSGLHAQNLAKGLSAGLADVENQAWQQGQNRSLQAAGMLPQMAGMQFGAADALRAAGGDRQQQAQQEISASVLQDQQAKSAEMSAIQNYLSLVSGLGGQFGTQTQTQSQNAGLMGMLGFGLQAAPLLFSDRRLKEDIRKVGKTDDGLGIFTYKYKGNPTTHMGVMAQEVKKKKPDAVHKVGGFLAVDYGAI